jgi:hypothetical protein
MERVRLVLVQDLELFSVLCVERAELRSGFLFSSGLQCLLAVSAFGSVSKRGGACASTPWKGGAGACEEVLRKPSCFRIAYLCYSSIEEALAVDVPALGHGGRGC